MQQSSSRKLEWQKLPDDHVFVAPKKEIHNPTDLERWTKSEAYKEYIGFLNCINDAVRGKSNSHPIQQSQSISIIVGVLDKLSTWIDETPPIDQPQRFGNKAFRTWYGKICEHAETVLAEALPPQFTSALHEITIYLLESFGNSTRIDYGTGHEMSFVMFMYCLFRIGVLDISSADDRIGSVTKIFDRYLGLVRKLQVTYRMEPAGSHGAWSLDDFQFVPFIWGSSQLIANPKIEPQMFPETEVIQQNATEYMFFGCLQYILDVKTGPFHEHSNQLWNISGSQSWTKVNQGLIKMYQGEVLAKFPVIQHTFFGSLFSITESTKRCVPGIPGNSAQLRFHGHVRPEGAETMMPPPAPPST